MFSGYGAFPAYPQPPYGGYPYPPQQQPPQNRPWWMEERHAYQHAIKLYEECFKFSSVNYFKQPFASDLEEKERKRYESKQGKHGNVVDWLYIIHTICAKNVLDLKNMFEDKCMVFDFFY